MEGPLNYEELLKAEEEAFRKNYIAYNTRVSYVHCLRTRDKLDGLFVCVCSPAEGSDGGGDPEEKRGESIYYWACSCAVRGCAWVTVSCVRECERSGL